MRITPLILLLNFFLFYCNSKSEKFNPADTVKPKLNPTVLVDTISSSNEIPVNEVQGEFIDPYNLDFRYFQSDKFSVDEKFFFGEWITTVPDFHSHPVFSILFKEDNQFVATFSNDIQIEWRKLEGTFGVKNNTLHLMDKLDTIALEIIIGNDDFFSVGKVISNDRCERKFPKYFLKNRKVEEETFKEKYLIGKWIGIDGELELREDYTFDTCCSGGTWSFDNENNLIYLKQTFSDAGEEPIDLVWDINEQNLHSIYINHRYENPDAQFPHLYFRQFNEIETLTIDYSKGRTSVDSNIKYLIGCF